MKVEAVWCANVHTIAILLIVLPTEPWNFIKEQPCDRRNIFDEAEWDKTSNLQYVRVSSNVWPAPTYFHLTLLCIFLTEKT